MIFNSYSFLFIFLPIALITYFMANKFFKQDIANHILIILSFIFILYSGLYNAVMFLISLFANSVFNAVLGKDKEEKHRKIILTIAVICNIAFLCVFKYGNTVLGMIGRIDQAVYMPLGISFYTFWQISYVIENYKYNFHKDYGMTNYILNASFFAKFLQGPISYHDELMLQSDKKVKASFSFDNFSQGLYSLALGLSKKVLVADNFAKIVEYGYGHILSLNSFEAILTILSYSLQLYFDFSGYCDMAVGVAKMFNINLPQNFNSPYKAKNISDFWKRWHMTLTRFLTKYVYITLGGNRKGKVQTYINIIFVFLVSGIWHGIGFTFLVWGLLHGIASVLYRMYKKQYDQLPGFIQWFFTFTYVNVAWVVFRASTLKDATALLKQVFVGGISFTINAELTETLLQPTIISVFSQFLPFVVVIFAFMVIAILICLFAKNTNECVEQFKPKCSNLIVTYILLCMSIVSISGVSAFLYVNF